MNFMLLIYLYIVIYGSVNGSVYALMPLQIYNNKMPLSSILISIFISKVKFIDIEIDDKSRLRAGRNAQMHKCTGACNLCSVCNLCNLCRVVQHVQTVQSVQGVSSDELQ